jgi:hypothetical protein
MSPPVQPELRETAASDRGLRPGAARASSNAFEERSRDWRRWLINLGVAAAAGVFLALVGALGTDELPLGLRLAYWTPLMMGGAFVGHAVSLAVGRLVRPEMNPWIFGAVLSVALTLPITVVVLAYTGVMFGSEFSARAFLAMVGPVFVICIAMTALMLLVNWPGRVTHAPPPGTAPASVRFLDRLPPKLKGAALYAVSAEDHYLRLHTSKGSDLILMRLADALSELEGLEGAQTHRSWWVAKDAVESARRDGDRLTLTLKGGAEAPVSRPNAKPLREAGWF